MTNGKCCTIISNFSVPSFGESSISTKHTKPQKDLLELIINAVLLLGNPNGSTSEEILDVINGQNGIGDDALSVDPAILEQYLLIGTRRGIFKYQTYCDLMDPRYLIRSNMTSLNSKNKRYARSVCEFYRDGGRRSGAHGGSSSMAAAKKKEGGSSGNIFISLDGISDTRPGACSTCNQLLYLTPCAGSCYSSY